MVTLRECSEVRKVQGLDGGKTLGITLPKSWMKAIGIRKGDMVKLTKQKTQVMIDKLEL